MSCGEPDARERARPVRRAGRGNGPTVTPAPRPVPTQRRDAEVAVSELALDDDQRYALASHFDGVDVPEPMWREAPPHSCRAAGALGTCRSRRPVPAARRAVDDAQQRTDRQRAPHVKPGFELLPSPCVHADLATTPALAAADQHCAAAWIELALGQSQSLPDAQPGSPHDHDQSAKAAAVRRVAASAHDGDDLFHLRRIGRVTQTLVGWSVAGVESRHRRRRSTSTGTVEQKLGHDLSSGLWTNPTIGARQQCGRPGAAARYPFPTRAAANTDPRARSRLPRSDSARMPDSAARRRRP
jgi:hypothetical protein